MARTNLLIALAIFVAAAAAAWAPSPAAAGVTCGTVQAAMAPCLIYLRTSGASPDNKCCAGVKSLVTSATTTADRHTACGCLKTAATKVPGIIASNAANLPGACHANIPYKISISTNCNNIK